MYAGVSTPHKKGEAFSRLQGQSYWTIMCFSTPFMIMNENSELIRGEAGDYIIQPPFVPLYHINVDDSDCGFINDWIVVRSEKIGKLIYDLSLPLNTLFRLNDKKLLASHLEKIINEDNLRSPYYMHKIFVYIEEMLIEIKRALTMDSTRSDRAYRRILRVRKSINEHIGEQWTLEKMAELANLSPSRFSDLYKKYFSISPVNDLILNRIEAAKRLLIATDFSIEEIAESCGFSSIHYFSNCFKKHTGMAPSEIRKI